MASIALIVYLSLGATSVGFFGIPTELEGGEDTPVDKWQSCAIAVGTWPIWTTPLILEFVKDFRSRL